MDCPGGNEWTPEATRQLVRMRADCVLLVYDVNDVRTYDSLRIWYEECVRRLDYQPKVFIVGNKCDEVSPFNRVD